MPDLKRSLRLGKKSQIIISIAFIITLTTLNQLYLTTSRGIKSESTFIEKSEILYVPNNTLIEILFLNYKQTAADLLWLRTISYFADHFNSDRQYLWLEHFIDQIISLDSRFKRVYYWAGTNVLYGRRFTNKNVRISNTFYEKALEKFPDDYEAPYRLGLNYYIEMKSEDRREREKFKEIGLGYLEMAANRQNAPNNIKKLVASISSKLGKSQIALQYFIELYINTENETKKKAILRRIKKIRFSTNQGDLLDEAKSFSQEWKKDYPYISSELFSLIKQDHLEEDLSFIELLPDINIHRKLKQP